MPLSTEAAKGLAKDMISLHEAERSTLDDVRLYWKGRQRLPGVIPSSAPNEIRAMARMARVNIIDLVIVSLTQSLFVDGIRDGDGNNVPAWDVWQANKMDRGQIGVHRSALAYGTSYVGVLGNDQIRGFSPRRVSATYADDPDWPFAVIVQGGGMWTLFDEEARYRFGRGHAGHLDLIDSEPHGYDAPPFVRFRDEEDLDLDDEASDSRGGSPGLDHPVDHVAGQVAPLIPLQDQIDVTTFDLLSTQHYGAFRQKAVVGWEPKSQLEQLQAAANRMWTFGDHPDEIKFHEFTESDLKGYIDSRDKSIRHAAALSQTPSHELADLVNLSAEALVAAEAGRNRKVNERQTGFGESWEQVLQLVGPVPDDAQVVWRETSSRAFAAIVDGLGKIAQMLQVPPQELWERIPGTTQQDVKRWRDAAEAGDSLASFTQLLAGQAAPAGAADGVE